jgi:hypothetical protein
MDFYNFVYNKAIKVVSHDKAVDVAKYVTSLPPNDVIYIAYMDSYKVYYGDIPQKTVRYLNRKEEVLNQN